MSLKDSWLIVKDTDWREFLALFQLREVQGEHYDRQFGYVELPSGWAALWGGSNRFHGLVELLQASQLGMTIQLEVNDQVTFLSSLTAAKDCKQLWEISVGEDEKLVVNGDPPLGIEALRNLPHGFEELMGGDHDIPIALAKSLTGFDYQDFLDRVRYLESMAESPLAPEPPSPLQLSIGIPLKSAFERWIDLSTIVSVGIGEFIKHMIMAILVALPFVTIIMLIGWILGAISARDY